MREEWQFDKNGRVLKKSQSNSLIRSNSNFSRAL